jgi:hypothetical protein
MAYSSSILYFHDAASDVAGTLPGGTTESTADSTPSFTVTGAATNRKMNGTIGVAAVNQADARDSGAGVVNWWLRRFVSDPLDGAQSITGPWSLVGGFQESSTNANWECSGGVFYVWRPSTGARIGYVFDLPNQGATEPGTAATIVQTSSITSSTVAALDGDVLVFEWWADQTAVTMTGVYTRTLYYDGTTTITGSDPRSRLFHTIGTTFSFKDPVVASGPTMAPRSRSWQHLIRRAVAGGYRRRRSGICVPELWLPESSGAPLTVPV